MSVLAKGQEKGGILPCARAHGAVNIKILAVLLGLGNGALPLLRPRLPQRWHQARPAFTEKKHGGSGAVFQ